MQDIDSKRKTLTIFLVDVGRVEPHETLTQCWIDVGHHRDINFPFGQHLIFAEMIILELETCHFIPDA